MDPGRTYKMHPWRTESGATQIAENLISLSNLITAFGCVVPLVNKIQSADKEDLPKCPFLQTEVLYSVWYLDQYRNERINGIQEKLKDVLFEVRVVRIKMEVKP